MSLHNARTQGCVRARARSHYITNTYGRDCRCAIAFLSFALSSSACFSLQATPSLPPSLHPSLSFSLFLSLSLFFSLSLLSLSSVSLSLLSVSLSLLSLSLSIRTFV